MRQLGEVVDLEGLRLQICYLSYEGIHAHPSFRGSGRHAHDDVELQLELVVEQHDEHEQEHVDVVLHAQLVLVDAAMSSAGVKSSTSKVSASSTAMWDFNWDIRSPPFPNSVGAAHPAPMAHPMWLQLVVDVELVALQLVELQLQVVHPQQLDVEQLDHANPG